MSVVVRSLAADEGRLLVAARLVAVEHAPYLAHALFGVTPLAAEGLGTFAVDRGWRLYLDPAALAGWGPTLAGGVLVHEVGHLVRAHAERADALGAELDHDCWNLACFPAGTLLPQGIPIENAATMEREFSGDLIAVSTQAGSVAVTPEHPFWTRQRRYSLGVQPRRLSAAAWVAASELREGDYICVPRLADKVCDTEIDLRPYVVHGTDSLGRATFANRAVPRIRLDADTAWLIGLYVAEGDASPNVRFSLGAHEAQLATRIESVIASLGWSARRSVSGTSMVVFAGATVFGRWLREQCGTCAQEKHVPEVIMRHSDPVIRRAFLDGLVNGDGHRWGRRGHPWCKVATSSEALMRDLVLLLAQDGIGCYTSIQAQRPRSIRGVPLTLGTLYGVSWNHNGISVTPRFLNGNTIPSTSHRWRSDAEGVWYPIKRLAREPFEGTVFNLTTPSHSYVAGGYLVHNCDCAINDDLLAAGIPLPSGAVTPALLGLPESGIEEAYYAALGQQTSAWRSGAAADDRAGAGCGSGAGEPSADWELPTDDPEAPALGPAEASMTRRLVAEAIREHAGRRGRGTVPAGWRRWAAATLAGPTIPWRHVLGAAVRRAIAHAAGCWDYAYHRPARRRIPRVVLPAMRRPLVTVAVVVDTSGSMGQGELEAALAEIKGVIQAAGLGARRLLVLACDATVGATSRVQRVEQVTLVGGGGTDLRVGIAAAEASQPRPDIVVVLTDGLTPWPERPGRARLVVALIGGADAARHVPAWATTVRVGAA